MLSRQDRLKVIQNELSKSGKALSDVKNTPVEEMKITNDDAFYRLICEKRAHDCYINDQFDLLYYDISEKMIRRPFTIKEINDFCEANSIPKFKIEELVRLVPKVESQNFMNYIENPVQSLDVGYLSNQIEVTPSFETPNEIQNKAIGEYLIDSDSYYHFILQNVRDGNMRNFILLHLNEKTFSEEGARSYILRYADRCDSEFRQWVQNHPKESIKTWLEQPENHKYTNKEYQALYQSISEKLVHTSMSIDTVKEKYEELGIQIPKDEEFQMLKKQQDELLSAKHWEKTTGLTFQGQIKLHIENKDNNNLDDQPNTKKLSNTLDINIDIYEKPLKADSETNAGSETNAEYTINKEIIECLKDTVIKVNDAFGVKQDNNPFLGHGNVANFRLFLFDDLNDYTKHNQHGNQNINIPAGGLASSSDNNYICNLYTHAETAKDDHNNDGETNAQDYHYVIKHEFVHGLTYYLTSKLDLGKVLMEGLAEYITLSTEGRDMKYFANLVTSDFEQFTLEELMKGEYLTQPEQNFTRYYEVGAALVAYIEETYPHFINNLLHACAESRKDIHGRFRVKEMKDDLYHREAEAIKNNGGFQKWVANDGQQPHTDGKNAPGDQEIEYVLYSHEDEEQQHTFLENQHDISHFSSADHYFIL